MAKMTIGDIVAELNARGFNAYLTAQKERYANWAYFDVARACRYVAEQQDSTYNFAQGDFAKALTDRSVRMVWDKTDDGYERQLMPMTEYEWASWFARDLTDALWEGKPEYYYIWDNQLFIKPKADKARTIITQGWGGISELASGGTPITDQELDPAIVARALYYCHLRAMEPDAASAAAATADQLIYDFMGAEGLQMDEREERVEPDTGWGIAY